MYGLRAAALLLLAFAATARGQVQSAILNGRDADRGRYPYIASLRYPYFNDTRVRASEFVCTGVLIRPDVVATTAWCVLNSGIWPTIRLGSHETYGGPAEVRSVTSVVWHKGYTAAEDDVSDDIALMLLNKPSTIRPVKVAAATPLPSSPLGTRFTIAGWGLTKDRPTAQAKSLRSAVQVQLTQQQCFEKWSSMTPPIQAGGWDSLKFICTGFSGHNKALCWGDAGAPLILRGTRASADVVVGLGSQSNCKGFGVLGGSIYTKLQSYAGWVNGGVRTLRQGGASRGKYVVARKADSPPATEARCKRTGWSCDLNAPISDCCSGVCLVWTCMPPPTVPPMV